MGWGGCSESTPRLTQRLSVAARFGLPLRWYAPATTRHEYVPVGSLMTSLSSNGRIRGVPTQRCKLGVADGFHWQHLRSVLAGWGAGLCRPSVVMDDNRELTWMYLQRVGTALYPSTASHGLVAGWSYRKQ